MVKLTVIYRLDDKYDLDEFIKWRTTEEEEHNASEPGVIKTDCYVVRTAVDKQLNVHKPSNTYQFVTEMYYNTMEDLEANFFSEECQEGLRNSKWDTERIDFLISELISETINE